VFVVLQCKFKKEIKETGREIRKGNPPPRPYLCAAYTSGATYTQFPDSCGLRCVLRGKSETVSCRNRPCWQCCLSGWSKENARRIFRYAKCCLVSCCRRWRFEAWGRAHSGVGDQSERCNTPKILFHYQVCFDVKFDVCGINMKFGSVIISDGGLVSGNASVYRTAQMWGNRLVTSIQNSCFQAFAVF